MKHSGKASLAGIKLICITLAAILLLLGVAWLGEHIAAFVLDSSAVLFGLWVIFALFTAYFFRDPDPLPPIGPNLVVSPGHGTVDVIDTTTETEFMGGECRRVSIFLSVFNIHVQNAPVTGKISHFRHTPGQYMNAMRIECASCNENVLVGIESVEPRGEKIGVRLIAGLIARRIVPWISENDVVQRGERISMIQFGSRVDIYLPLRAKIKAQVGEKVVGGQTIIASFD